MLLLLSLMIAAGPTANPCEGRSTALYVRTEAHLMSLCESGQTKETLKVALGTDRVCRRCWLRVREHLQVPRQCGILPRLDAARPLRSAGGNRKARPSRKGQARRSPGRLGARDHHHGSPSEHQSVPTLTAAKLPVSAP